MNLNNISNDLTKNVKFTFDDWFADAFQNMFLDAPDAILMRNVWQIAKESPLKLNEKFPKYLFTDKKYKIIKTAWNAAKNH